MKKSIKNVFYTTSGLSLLALNKVNVFAIDITATKTATPADNITGGDFVGTLESMFSYLVGLLYFIAVAFGVYAGFLILTAGGEEEKAKKGKTTLINAVIGLIVIFLASNIVNWLISVLGGGSVGTV